MIMSQDMLDQIDRCVAHQPQDQIYDPPRDNTVAWVELWIQGRPLIALKDDLV